jgi:tetratricopeptide (TPR) repeat protein
MKSKLIFFLLVCLAFSLRCAFFNQTAGFIQPGTGSDPHFYLQWAMDIVRGNVLGSSVFYALPVYPYFLSLAYLLSGGEVFGLILIQTLLGSINCGLIYILGVKLFNNRVGISASIIACAYLMFIFYDRLLLPASLAIFSGLVLLFLLLRLRDNPSLKRWIGAGLALGLCSLIAASFSLLAVFILFWIIFEYSNKTLNKRLLYCISFILSFAFVIGGVSLRNYLVSGDRVLVTAHSGINFYVGNNPQASGLFQAPVYMRPTQSGLIEDAKVIAERLSARRLKPSEVSHFWVRRALAFAGRHPLGYLRLLARKFILFWNGKEYIDEIEHSIYRQESRLFRWPNIGAPLIIPLAIGGILLSWSERKRLMPVYLFVISVLLGCVLFFINSRYRLQAFPYLIIFAAFFLCQLWERCKQKRYKELLFLAGFFLALFLVTNIKVTRASAQLDSTLHYNKGIYLSDQKRLQDAKREFQAALEINPVDFMSYFALGNVYFQMQDLTRAQASYEQSLAINPYFYKPHFNLGLTYEKMNDYEQAELELKKALALYPDDCAAHYNLGRIYQKKGLNDLALKEYQRALEIKPGHPEVLEAIDEVVNEE